MRLFYLAFVSVLTLSAQDPQAKSPEKKPATKAAAKATSTKATPAKAEPAKSASPAAGIPRTIPADAVPDGTGDYRHTDAEGKKWIYRMTPFGLTRREDTPEFTAVKTANAAGIKATEDGDIVRFERLGPFGVWRWTKNKSELDEVEKAALRNSQANNQTVSK
jgi:hypothetical protein